MHPIEKLVIQEIEKHIEKPVTVVKFIEVEKIIDRVVEVPKIIEQPKPYEVIQHKIIDRLVEKVVV